MRTWAAVRVGVSMRSMRPGAGRPVWSMCAHAEHAPWAGAAHRVEFPRYPFGSGPKGKCQKQEFEHGYV